MSLQSKQPSCKRRWLEHKNCRLADLRKLWHAYCDGREEVADLGSIHEYGLSFDYVAPDTYHDQREGYWRWQFSWGGPSDELRLYSSGSNLKPYRVEYWFLDWFDGHGRALRGRDLALSEELWDWLVECGTTEDTYRKGVE